MITQASCSFHNANGELDATRQLFSETDVAGRVITLDALHASIESVGLIVEAQVDYMLTLKDNTALQLDQVKLMNWRSHRVRRHAEQLTNAQGSIELRHIAVLEVDDPQWFDFRQVRQAYRIDREVFRETDSASRETVYGITSVGAGRARCHAAVALGPRPLGGDLRTPTITFVTAHSKKMPA